MGNVYTSAQTTSGNPVSWVTGSTYGVGTTFLSQTGRTKVYFQGTSLVTTAPAEIIITDGSYAQNIKAVITNKTGETHWQGIGESSNSFTSAATLSDSGGGAGITYVNTQTQSLLKSTSMSSDDLRRASTLNVDGSIYTDETTYENKTTKYQTDQSTSSVTISTGAAGQTYTGSVPVCTSTTKSTNDTDSASTMFSSVDQTLSLTRYTDEDSFEDTYTYRTASTITTTPACRTNCVRVYEYYIDTNEALTVSSDANGNELVTKDIYTTRYLGPGVIKITESRPDEVLKINKGYINATITDSAQKSIKRTIGNTNQLIYSCYTHNENADIITTNITYNYGLTYTRYDLIHAPVYTLTQLTSEPTTTTVIGVFPYYHTYTTDDTTGARQVGYLSLEQETTMAGSSKQTTVSYTSDYTGITSFSKSASLSESFSGSFTYTSDTNNPKTYSETRVFASGSTTYIDGAEEEARHYLLDEIKLVGFYPSPLVGLRDYVPAMAPGTVAFGVLPDAELYTSHIPYNSLKWATDGEVFTNYNDSVITAQMVRKLISNSVSLIPTGKCFDISSTTSATYKWMTSSDWPQSATSSQMSARFASTSTYTTSVGGIGDTSRVTRTATDYKSLTMSLSLDSPINEASATDNFVVVKDTNMTIDKLNSFYDVAVGINHKDKMSRNRNIYFPAGHYSITRYPENQGTSDVQKYTTQSTAAWLQTVDDNVRLRISSEPLCYIETYKALAGNAGAGAGFSTVRNEFNYDDDEFFP